MTKSPRRDYAIRYRYANGDDHAFHVSGVRNAAKILRDIKGFLYREVSVSITEDEIAEIEARAKPPHFGFGARK